MPMIIGEVKRYLRDNNMIRVSRSVRDLAYKSLKAKEALASKLGRDPTTDEIAQKLAEDGTPHTKAEIADALEAIVEPVSLYDPVYGDDSSDGVYVIDRLCDSGGSEDSWLEDIALREAMKRLSDREKTILNMRFYKGKTQMEIADEIGISQAQVSRLEKGALKRIKSRL